MAKKARKLKVRSGEIIKALRRAIRKDGYIHEDELLRILTISRPFIRWGSQ